MEKDTKPRILTGRNISAMLQDFPNDFGKDKKEEIKKRKKIKKKILDKKGKKR